MMSLPIAKVLLFIALSTGPQGAQTIYATSNSEGYVMTSEANGWNIESKGFPSADWTRDPSVDTSIGGAPSRQDVPHFLGAVSRHDWSHDSMMIFANGDRVEKCGDHVFYIVNAGGANEKDYTIFFSQD